MPPKKSRKFGRRGRPKQAAPSPPLRPPSSQSSPDRNSDGDDQRRSRSGSNASSVASGAVFVAASDASTSSEAQKDKQKRAKKTPYSLNTEEEMSMLEFLQENPMIWNIKLTDFRMTEKKNRLWADQAARLDKTADCLKGWFKSLRDIYTRLDKKKSGDGAPELTEREQWVKDNFSFLKAATRHRPQPVNSVKAVIDAYPGNLVAAEAAFEELVDVEDRAPSSTRSSNTVRKDKRAKEEDILQSLQNKVRQSGELLKCLNQPQPMNERTAFANYVRDSLLTMSKPKFRKARSAINNVLTKAMEDDTEYEEELPTPSDVLHNMPPPVRQVSASAVLSPSQSEMYQPPPHMWRHKPPQASVWASASPEYVEQYMQQPLQPQQQPPQQQPSQQQEQNILSPQTSMGYLSAVLGPASQVLNQSPNISDL